ncbi:hypothetical protein DFH07DRAFT_960546 [Mycena maculata]|uniref:Uncharacterized protein n=1 Tax=Mycena maculata TaxID=230809 RepID=A0AAD7IYI9_9AGAR|nr:hypothetical protein DFH07DRAFT_960546 [Mycena maculata]
MSRKILPALGACAVLTIDPLASLNSETLEDAEAVAACKKLVNKQYVGIVGRREGLYQPWAPYNACSIEFLLQGEPKGFPERCIESFMSIPILPVSIEAHPSSRIPLKPSNPLPWNDCYLSTFWGARVRSPSLFTEAPIDCIFDFDEMCRHRRFLEADLARHEALCSAAAQMPETLTSPANSISEPAPLSTLPRDGPSSTLTHLEPEFGRDSTRSVSLKTADIDEDGDSMEEPVNPFFSNAAEKQMITVNFTHDLSTVKELNDPAEFFREVEAIARIEEAARPRILAAKARAIKAAAEIDAKAYDEPTVDLLAARPRGRISRLVSRLKGKRKSLVRRFARWVLPGRISS